MYGKLTRSLARSTLPLDSLQHCQQTQVEICRGKSHQLPKISLNEARPSCATTAFGHLPNLCSADPYHRRTIRRLQSVPIIAPNQVQPQKATTNCNKARAIHNNTKTFHRHCRLPALPLTVGTPPKCLTNWRYTDLGDS